MNNNIDIIYSSFINLMKEMDKSKENKIIFLEKRSRIDYLVTRFSNKMLRDEGLVDYDKTIKIINECYFLSKILGIYKLTKLIINDMLRFSQSLRMDSLSSCEDGPNINYWEIIQKLCDDLFLICYSYGVSREENSKWKNITSQLVSIDKSEQFMEYENRNYKVSAFEIAKYIWDNDTLDNYFLVNINDCENYIIWLLRHGPQGQFPKDKFYSAIMALISKMTAKYFEFKEKRIFHITTMDNFTKIINNNQVWIKKREFLNDPEEQIAFKSIIKYDGLISDEINYAYVSFSATTSNVPNETIFRYGGGYKKVVILEFDKFNGQNIIYSLNKRKINDTVTSFIDVGSMIGRVVYEKDEMQEIWNKINLFLDKIKKEFGKKLGHMAKLKAANICKMFFKRKKFKNEKEIRIISHWNNSTINVEKNKEFFIFKPSILKSFNYIYSSLENIQKIKNEFKNEQIAIQSFEFANNFIHYNYDEIKEEFKDLFKDIVHFKNNPNK